MAVDLELVEAPEVVIIRVILMEGSSPALTTDQAEIEGAEVEVVIVMTGADVVDLQKDEKDVPEDIRVHLPLPRLG